MKRRIILGLVAVALLLGSTHLVAHDGKVHKATVPEVTVAGPSRTLAPEAISARMSSITH